MSMTDDFSAAPKVVKPKKKYKQPEPQQNEEQQIKLIYNNLMWDKRVFRGNTHAALVTLKNVDSSQQVKDTRGNFKPQQEPVQIQDNANKRANIEIFTDEFVETLTDKPPRYEYASQTDPLPEKPVVRHRIPERHNIVDVETQIWDDELFDFDYEVEPLLNVLCGRILEVSRMQVLQEQELTVMKYRQEELQLEEKAEREKIRQMYEQQTKLEMENARKIQAFRKEKDKKIKTHKRLFSRVLAKDFLKHLQENTLAIVERNGFFRNPLDIKIMNDVPSLFYQNATKMSQDQSQLISEAYSNYLFSKDIAQEARAGILKQHAWAKQVERTRRNQIIFKRQELARQKQQRQRMKGEEKEMREFLVQQKIQKQKEDEEKRKAQEAEENGEAPPEEN